VARNLKGSALEVELASKSPRSYTPLQMLPLNNNISNLSGRIVDIRNLLGSFDISPLPFPTTVRALLMGIAFLFRSLVKCAQTPSIQPSSFSSPKIKQ
jgi:hypothetical protein